MYLGQSLLTLLLKKSQRGKKVQRKMTRRRRKRKRKKREARKMTRKRKRKKRKKKSRRFRLHSQSYSPSQRFLLSGLYLHRHRELLQSSSLCLRSV